MGFAVAMPVQANCEFAGLSLHGDDDFIFEFRHTSSRDLKSVLAESFERDREPEIGVGEIFLEAEFRERERRFGVVRAMKRNLPISGACLAAYARSRSASACRRCGNPALRRGDGLRTMLICLRMLKYSLSCPSAWMREADFGVGLAAPERSFQPVSGGSSYSSVLGL
jgi:hypothetical protein